MSNQSKPNSCGKTTKKPPRPIPKIKVPQGIQLCKENISDFLNDARNILSNGKSYHAYVSFEFALEEFGKIIILKKALNDPNNTTDTAQVDEIVFTSHKDKCDKAIEVLGKDFESLYNGAWPKGMWKPNMWGETEVAIGHNTRLKCAFVDYVNNEWHIGDKAITQYNLGILINKLDAQTKLE
jgi:AbiV family abortive infection protein